MERSGGSCLYEATGRTNLVGMQPPVLYPLLTAQKLQLPMEKWLTEPDTSCTRMIICTENKKLPKTLLNVKQHLVALNLKFFHPIVKIGKHVDTLSGLD